MTITNIQHFLVQSEDDIRSIPSLAARLDAVEASLGYQDDEDESPVEVAGPSPVVVDDIGGGGVQTFDQGDSDELFADGGATERSYDIADAAELFESPNI